MPYKDKARQREYQRKWKAKRRAEWIESQGGQCRHCGSTERLEVDHIDPSLKHSSLCQAHGGHISSMWSWSKERLEKELQNCQLLCAECHAEKTRMEGSLSYGRRAAQRWY